MNITDSDILIFVLHIVSNLLESLSEQIIMILYKTVKLIRIEYK
jgi:hypothetical protein